MNSLLLWFGALLAAVLTALFAVPQFVDWTLYRGQFEAEASRLLGREVRVAGSVAVELLPTPRIAFDRVRIADVPLNPNDQPGEPILRAERIELGLGISGLLRGDLDVNKVVVVNPDVRLSFAADGRGNWQTLVLRQGSLPMSPNELTIGGVSVTGGRLSVTGPDARGDLFALTNIDGDVETVVGGGPLRFRGMLDWAGERHDLRLSTADAQAGGLRVKAVLRAVSSGGTVTFDGALFDLAGVPRVDGEVVAKMPGFAATNGAAATGGDIAKEPSAATTRDKSDTVSAAPPGVEFRARVTGDGRGAKLENAAFSFERDGQPQLLTGSVDIGWANGMDVRASLQSRWLDVDRMTSGGAQLRPLDAARTLIRKIDAMLPERGRFDAQIAIDQVTLGGEAISAVAVGLSGHDGRLAVERFEANLPGAAHLSIAGSASSDASAFDGRMLLRANSATRLLGWAARDTEFATLGPDVSFVMAANLTTDTNSLALADIDAEIAGQRLTGLFRRVTGPRPLTTIALRSRSLDIAGPLPGILDPARIGATLAGTAEPDRSPLLRWFDPAKDDVSLRLNIGQLTDGRSRIRDVVAELELAGGGIAVRALRYKGAGGFAVDVTGSVANAGSADRTGALGWHVVAPSTEAVAALVTAAGLPADFATRKALPVRLAGTVTLPQDLSRPAEIMLDGDAGASRITATLRAGRRMENWRDQPFEARLDIAGPEAFNLAGLEPATARTRSSEPAPRVSVRLAGVPASGVITKFAARSSGPNAITADFDGALTLKAAKLMGSGILVLEARDGADIARTAGLPFPTAFRDLPIAGRFGVATDEQGLTIALDGVRLASATVSGSILRKPSGAVDASLVSDRVAIRDLLAALTVPTATPGYGPPSPGPWPEGTFDLAALLKSEGTLTLAARRFEVDGDTALQDATISAKLVPGRLEVTSLTATMLEGQLNSTWTLTAGPAEATLAGTVEVANVDLAAAPAGRQAAKGRVSGNLSVEGRGFGPRTLLQFVSGKGSLTLAEAEVPGLNAAAVRQASQSYLASETPPEPNSLATLVRDTLQHGNLTIGTKKIDVEVSGGALKLGQFRVDTPEATLTNRTTVDIASFDTVSEWRIAPAARDVGTKRREALPAVEVVFTGPAWAIARTEPEIRTEELSRELAVRLMERDVEELERLRRLDEQRVREEAERRRAFEAARAAEAASRAAAAAAAGGAGLPNPNGALPGSPAPKPDAPVAGEVKTGDLPPPTATASPAPKPAFQYPARPSSEPWWGTQFLYPSR